MFKIVKEWFFFYFVEGAKCAFWSSWDSANNLAGSVIIGGLALIIPLPIIHGSTELVKWENGAISLIIYTICAWFLLLILRIIFVSPFILWRKLGEKNAELGKLIANSENKTPFHSVDILIGTGTDYERTESRHLYGTSRTISVALKNTGSAYLSNCRFYIEFINYKNEKRTHLLIDNLTLNEGEDRFIPIVSFNEPNTVLPNTDKANWKIELYLPITGGCVSSTYLAERYLLGSAKHTITLRVTSREIAPYEINGLLWIDDSGKLRFEKI